MTTSAVQDELVNKLTEREWISFSFLVVLFIYYLFNEHAIIQGSVQISCLTVLRLDNKTR